MSHRHYCDVAGHYWECAGPAVRPYAGGLELTPCMCYDHGVPIEDGDHSKCRIELLACPEHLDEQVGDAGTLDMSDPTGSPTDVETSVFKDKDGNPIVGFCLWCNRDFYSFVEAEAHEPDGGEPCPVMSAHRTCNSP